MMLSKNEKLSRHVISLDIDATLCSSDTEMDFFERLELYTNPSRAHLRSRVYTIDMIDVGNRAGVGVKTKMWGVYRPHLFKFIRFCSFYFQHSNIWSAGQPKYVDAMCGVLFPDWDNQPHIVYDWNDCQIGENWVRKPLVKLLEDSRSKEAGFTVQNTFALDDRDDTFSENPYNGILIPIYEPRLSRNYMTNEVYELKDTIADIEADDICLLQLMYWLSLPEVMYVQDIRTLDKSRIFTTSISTYQQMLTTSRTGDVARPLSKLLADSERESYFEQVEVA